MIIGKVLNNNVVFSTNEKGEEIIYMGWGLALQKKAGDTIDSTKTMRRFSRETKEPAYLICWFFCYVCGTCDSRHRLAIAKIIKGNMICM